MRETAKRQCFHYSGIPGRAARLHGGLNNWVRAPRGSPRELHQPARQPAACAAQQRSGAGRSPQPAMTRRSIGRPTDALPGRRRRRCRARPAAPQRTWISSPLPRAGRAATDPLDRIPQRVRGDFHIHSPRSSGPPLRAETHPARSPTARSRRGEQTSCVSGNGCARRLDGTPGQSGVVSRRWWKLARRRSGTAWWSGSGGEVKVAG